MLKPSYAEILQMNENEESLRRIHFSKWSRHGGWHNIICRAMGVNSKKEVWKKRDLKNHIIDADSYID